MDDGFDYRLTIDVKSPVKLVTWDMAGIPAIRSFLALCLKSVIKSRIKRFYLRRLDGPSIESAVERSRTVAVSDDGGATWSGLQ